MYVYGLPLGFMSHPQVFDFHVLCMCVSLCLYVPQVCLLPIKMFGLGMGKRGGRGGGAS